jgi:hypothetical protein
VKVTRCAQITTHLACRRLVVLAPRKTRARQSDAGVAMASGGDSDVGTAATYGHIPKRGIDRACGWPLLGLGPCIRP